MWFRCQHRKKLLKLEKKNKQNTEYEELLRDTHGEEFDLPIGGTDDPNQYTGTITKPVEFNVDELINKTFEYNYTLEAINKGGIPE